MLVLSKEPTLNKSVMLDISCMSAFFVGFFSFFALIKLTIIYSYIVGILLEVIPLTPLDQNPCFNLVIDIDN